MLLVLLGTQPHPFDRLIRELFTIIDSPDFVELGIQKVVIQAGNTKVPEHPNVTSFSNISHEAYLEAIASATCILTHGGAGSIFDALRAGKKVISMPRLVKYGEHVDDHQQELVEQLATEQYIIAKAKLAESFSVLPVYYFKPYVHQQEEAIQRLAELIAEV